MRLAISLLAALALAGCGHGEKSEHPKPTRGEEEGGEEAARRLAERLPAADRLAFYQLSTSLGLAQARAVTAERGQATGVVTPAKVAAARERVVLLKPRDATLKRCRRQLADALATTARQRLTRASARRALREVRAARNLLSRYARRHREVLGLVPD